MNGKFFFAETKVTSITKISINIIWIKNNYFFITFYITIIYFVNIQFKKKHY